MIYQDRKKKYFIDCEMLVGPTYDLVVYANSVRHYKEGDEPLPDIKKQEILGIVAKLLISAKIRAEFQP